MIESSPSRWYFRPSRRCTDMTARSTSLIRLSPRTTLGISQFRPSRMLGSPRTAGTDAVSHPGWARSASSAICVRAPPCSFPSSLVADAFEFFRARFRHAAHAFASPKHGGADRKSQHHAHPCGVSPRRLAMILSRVRLGNTAAMNSRIGSGTIT